MVERLGDMRKGRRQWIEIGSRERKDPTQRCSLRVLQAYKFSFYKLIEYIIKKICHGIKQNSKICANGETECNET